MLSESTLIVTQALQATLQSTSDLPSDLQECLVSLGPILQHHPEQADTAVDSALQHLSTLPELYRIFQEHLDRLEEAQNPDQAQVFRRSKPSSQQILLEKPASTSIRPAPRWRTGWDKAFAKMAEQQDDALLDEANPTDWDRVEWEW
jgi:hypothetical protein